MVHGSWRSQLLLYIERLTKNEKENIRKKFGSIGYRFWLYGADSCLCRMEGIRMQEGDRQGLRAPAVFLWQNPAAWGCGDETADMQRLWISF